MVLGEEEGGVEGEDSRLYAGLRRVGMVRGVR